MKKGHLLNLKIALLFFCFSFRTASNAQVLSPEPKFSISIQEGESLNENGISYWLIPIALKNNSTENIQYRSWSCAWQDFFSVNKIEAQIVLGPCGKRLATSVILKPQEVKKETIRLKISPGTKRELKIRIGMDFIEIKDIVNSDDDRGTDLPDSGKVYWSNEITVQAK